MMCLYIVRGMCRGEEVIKVGISTDAERRLAEHKRQGLTGPSLWWRFAEEDARNIEQVWRAYARTTGDRPPLRSGGTEAVWADAPQVREAELLVHLLAREAYERAMSLHRDREILAERKAQQKRWKEHAR